MTDDLFAGSGPDVMASWLLVTSADFSRESSCKKTRDDTMHRKRRY